MVCENGLVICSKEFENLKIRHYGYDFEELQKVITTMVENLPLTVDSMNKFKKKQLRKKQVEEFAKKAAEIRFGVEQVKNIKIDYNNLITPTRPEDAGNDLWSVFNVIQEKLTHGMFEYVSGTKLRKARKIKNFRQDIDLNAKLYNLAMEYIA
jgi:ribosomal protein L29